MLAKKQLDRISLDDIKQHEIFKKHKMEFVGQAKTPRQSFMLQEISLANNKKSAQVMSTPRNCTMLDQEKKLIEQDINRKKTVHMLFRNASNTITVVDGNSVKKIDSASFFLHKTNSDSSRTHKQNDSSSPYLNSSSRGTKSNFLESLENLSPNQVKTFQHASVSTDPIPVCMRYSRTWQRRWTTNSGGSWVATTDTARRPQNSAA